MSNSSNSTSRSVNEIAHMMATYYALVMVILGTLLNLLTLFILCRPSFRDTQKRPTIHYMRAIAIFDIFMLYGWNLDHFMEGVFGYRIQYLAMPLCRFFTFWNYFTAQCSAWIRVFICLDRYLSLSRLHKTWFSQSKNVIIIILTIVAVFFCIHAQFFVVSCSYNSSGKLIGESVYYVLYPTFDYVNLVLYNCIPFLAMMTLNTGVIYHLFLIRQSSSVQNSRIQHRSITITLVITTFLFLLMTIPATVVFAFFYNDIAPVALYLFDTALYTYHILSFPLYLITFTEFRREVLQLLRCQSSVAMSQSNTVASLLVTKSN